VFNVTSKFQKLLYGFRKRFVFTGYLIAAVSYLSLDKVPFAGHFRKTSENRPLVYIILSGVVICQNVVNIVWHIFYEVSVKNILQMPKVTLDDFFQVVAIQMTSAPCSRIIDGSGPVLSDREVFECSWKSMCGPNPKKITIVIIVVLSIWASFILGLNVYKQVRWLQLIRFDLTYSVKYVENKSVLFFKYCWALQKCVLYKDKVKAFNVIHIS
jgi:hypothetical protein